MNNKLSYNELEQRLVQIECDLASKEDEVNKLKSSFLSNVSHHIRTPMNVIVGFSSLLNDTNFNNDQKIFFVEEINKSSKELLRLIDNIILTAKVETEDIKLDMGLYDVKSIADELFNYFKKDLNGRKNINFRLVRNSDNQNNNVFTDKSKLRLVLFNLIDNAIKFTVNGTIEFGYNIDGEVVEFYVKDTGVGINGKNINTIYKEFTQIEDNDSYSRNGLGLGLTISEKLIKLLGGKLVVKSTLGKGSSFNFAIPLLVKKPKRNLQVQV